MNETEIVFLSSTPVLSLIRKVNERFFRTGDKTANNALEKITDYLKTNSNRAGEPFFLFAHTLPPHPPSRYTADCKYGQNLQNDGLIKWNKAEYVTQVHCLNKDILDFVSTILREDKTNPIILLSADHGTASRDQFEKRLAQWDALDFRERFSVLNAALLPSTCRSHFNDKLSLVNNFRVVVACIQDRSPELLNDEFYLAAYENSPDYGKILQWKRNQIQSP